MIKKVGHASKNKRNQRRKAAIDSFIIKVTTSNQNYSPLTQYGIKKLDPNIHNYEKTFSRKILGDLKNNFMNYTSSNYDLSDEELHVGKGNYDGIVLKDSRTNEKIQGKENGINSPSRKLDKDSCRKNT